MENTMNVDWVKVPKTLAEKMETFTMKIDPREGGQGFNMGNCGVVGCWGTDSQGRKTLNGQVYIEPKKILCNDGSFDIQAQEPSIGMGKVAMACNGKGGISVNQPTPYTTPTQVNNTKEPIYYILVTAGVLVAGYFAYKKFKK